MVKNLPDNAGDVGDTGSIPGSGRFFGGGNGNPLKHLACLLRNLYAGQEATVRTGYGTTDWFQIGKGVHQRCILSPCLFNLYAEYIMLILGWKKHKLESRLLGEISIPQICR